MIGSKEEESIEDLAIGVEDLAFHVESGDFGPPFLGPQFTWR